MRAVERSIKTSHLWEFWKIGEKRPDRSQIMRLMKWGKRHEPLQSGYDTVVDQHWLAEIRSTVNNAVTDCDRANADFIAQPSADDAHCGWDVRNRFDRIDAVGQGFVVRIARPQARTTANAIQLALDLPPQSPLPFDRKDLELDARGACIDDEDGIHGDHAATVGAC